MSWDVSVIGQGFVGGSMTTVLAEQGIKSFVFDIAGKVAPGGCSTNSFNITEHVRFCDNLGIDIHFVCLPTPMSHDGSADTSIVREALEEIAQVPVAPGRNRVVIVKSTVPPGSCAGWNTSCAQKGTAVVFSPEFLTEANCLNDMRNQDRIVLGGDEQPVHIAAQLMESAFPAAKIVRMSSTNAELVKYIANCFLATKVSFSNEMKQICEGLAAKGVDCDFDNVIDVAVLDERLGKTHWRTPGPDGKPGFGGSCFPKDINALMHVARDAGVKPSVLSGAWEKNIEVRPERDWEKLKGRAVV
jgi:UDPglucose 6-dehydrogenase